MQKRKKKEKNVINKCIISTNNEIIMHDKL